MESQLIDGLWVTIIRLINKIGAIIFEMLTGLPPFYTTNREELFSLIKFGTLAYPPYLSPAARNLLEGLFHKNPEKRFGAEGAK